MTNVTPCRILTDAEVALVATITHVDARIVVSHMQDSSYCPWHEEEVNTLAELMAAAKMRGWFDYCRFGTAEQAVSPENTHCVHIV